MNAEIRYTAMSHDRFRCVVETNRRRLTIEGSSDGVDPDAEGSTTFLNSDALVESLGAYAMHEYQYRRTRSPEIRKFHNDARLRYSRAVLAIAAMTTERGRQRRSGWCSCCYRYGIAWRVDLRRYRPPAYLCGSCGAPITPCAAPRCQNFAERGYRAVGVPRYCAEHRHDLPSFAEAEATITEIDQYRQLLKFEKRNYAKATKYGLVISATAVAVVPMGIAMAPALGGALGASAIGGGLSGAAATSHGLAILGGGSLASGGLGMAGGTAVVAAAGASLGGALGATTVAAYARTDKSFGIQKLKGGTGTPILLASGFLSQNEDGWGNWRRITEARYPDSPVYRVHWGAKELKAFTALGARGLTTAAIARATTQLAARATLRGAAKIPGLGALMVAAGLLTNPWTVAVTRAQMTGAALATFIARTETDQFILMGHSLGARVMFSAAQVLGTAPGPPRLEDVHLLGAAVSQGEDLLPVSAAVSGAVYNYRSENDAVLKNLYRAAQLGKPAVGVKGFNTNFKNMKDRNVTARVPSHSDYFDNVTLA